MIHFFSTSILIYITKKQIPSYFDHEKVNFLNFCINSGHCESLFCSKTPFYPNPKLSDLSMSAQHQTSSPISPIFYPPIHWHLVLIESNYPFPTHATWIRWAPQRSKGNCQKLDWTFPWLYPYNLFSLFSNLFSLAYEVDSLNSLHLEYPPRVFGEYLDSNYSNEFQSCYSSEFCWECSGHRSLKY